MSFIPFDFTKMLPSLRSAGIRPLSPSAGSVRTERLSGGKRSRSSRATHHFRSSNRCNGRIFHVFHGLNIS